MWVGLGSGVALVCVGLQLWVIGDSRRKEKEAGQQFKQVG